MKKIVISICFLCSSFFTFAENLQAEVVFERAIWQKSVSEKAGPKVRFKNIDTLRLKADKKNPTKLRIITTLKNTGKEPVIGTILRYAFYFRIINIGDETQKPFWDIPFALEERRVSIIKPMRSKEVKTASVVLTNYLQRLENAGFLIDAVKAKVMVEPKKGDKLQDNTTESVIEVIYD